MSKRPVEKNPPDRRVKIMVFGTFDGLHQGHINFFNQAKKLTKNTFLIVSIARDKNVLKIKGERPFSNERERMSLVKNHKLADKIVLSGIKNHIPHIVKENPDIVALGYDQKDYVKNLKKDLKRGGLTVQIIRLKPYKEKIYKNKLLKRRE